MIVLLICPLNAKDTVCNLQKFMCIFCVVFSKHVQISISFSYVNYLLDLWRKRFFTSWWTVPDTLTSNSGMICWWSQLSSPVILTLYLLWVNNRYWSDRAALKLPSCYKSQDAVLNCCNLFLISRRVYLPNSLLFLPRFQSVRTFLLSVWVSV